MAQLDTIGHVVINETPADISAGLDAGIYAAQARDGRAYWSTATTAPTTLDAYESYSRGNFFWFQAGANRPPCWARTETGAGNQILARAEVIDGRVMIREHLAPVVLTTNPAELLDGEPNGNYLISPQGGDIWWASGATAPNTLSDFFYAFDGGLISFCQDAGSPVSLWVRSAAGTVQAIAARVFSDGP